MSELAWQVQQPGARPAVKKLPVGKPANQLDPLVFTCATLAILAGIVAATFGAPYVPGTTTAALALLVCKRPIERAASRILGPRGPAAGWLLLLSMALMLGIGAACLLYKPGGDHDFDPITSEMSARIYGFGYLGSVLTLSVGALVSHLLPWLLKRRALERGVRVAATAALALAVPLVGVAGLRALSHPDPDVYLRRIPTRAGTVLPALTELRPTSVRQRPYAGSIYETVTDGLPLLRVDHGSAGCSLSTGSGPGAIQSIDYKRAVSGHPVCGALTLLREPVGLVQVLSQGRIIAIVDHGRLDFACLANLAPALGPPLGWLAGGVVGICLGLWALAGGRRGRALLAAQSTWREGTHEGDGLVTFAGATPPCRLQQGTILAAGRVVVVPVQSESQPATYRTAGELGHVVAAYPGTAGELLQRTEADLLGRGAYGLAAVALTSAPLVAALAAGLLTR